MSRLGTAAFSLSARSTSCHGRKNSAEPRSDLRRCRSHTLNMSQSHDMNETESFTASQRTSRHSIDPESTNQIRAATKFRDNSLNVDCFSGCDSEKQAYILHPERFASSNQRARRRSMNALPEDQMMSTKIPAKSMSDLNLADDMEDDQSHFQTGRTLQSRSSSRAPPRRCSVGSKVPHPTRKASKFRSGSVMYPSVPRADRDVQVGALESNSVPPSLEPNQFISAMSMPSNKTATGFRRKSVFDSMEPNQANLSSSETNMLNNRRQSLESKQMQRRYSMLPMSSNQLGAANRERNKKQFQGNFLSPNAGLETTAIKADRRRSINSSSSIHTKTPNIVRRKSTSVPASNSRKNSGFQASTIMSQNRSRAGSTTSIESERQRKSLSINFSRAKQSTTNAESHTKPEIHGNANMSPENLVHEGVNKTSKERSPQKVVLASEISLDANPKSIILVQDNMWIALRTGSVEIRNARSGTLLKTLKPTSNARNFYVTSMYHHRKCAWSGWQCVWMGGTDGTLQAWKIDGSKMIGKVIAHTGSSMSRLYLECMT